MRKNFLLEVGCENLPSGYVATALGQIEKLFAGGLSDERIPYKSLTVLGTPKRLVVYIAGLSDKQEAVESTVVGPPAAVGLSPDGKYTKEASGFARSQGVPANRLTTVKTSKGEYLAVVRRIRGRSTVSLLGEKVPQWLQSVKFPKMMRWDSGGFRFARPVRWIVSIFGEKTL
ncbi:MAG: glycine--tRNA ligase subunit beta, partial [Candidatus Krumholzibacteria bacterium]|nr:glycine--tRNA ligase subunit beta [Candidatus Krumholzibacteria bacterium]